MRTKLRTLKIDLNTKTSRTEEQSTSESTLEEKLGGFGRGLSAVEKNIQDNPDLTNAYDSRNLLSFDTGFLTGSNVMTAKRTYVTGLSPLKTSKQGTNGIFYSAASGGLGPEIRECDLDSIQFTGKSDKLVYAVIEDGEVKFEDASALIGKDTNEKVRYLAGEAGHKGAFAVIGPSGEKLIRYANIAFSTNDQLKTGSSHMRFAGRGGMGAVMGSKNLLGVVVRGNGERRKVEGAIEANKQIIGDKTKKYHELGTFFGNIGSMEKLGVNIHQNFSRGSDSDTDNLYRNKVEENYNVIDKGCGGCGIKCWKEIRDKDGKLLGKLDFEPGMLLGPNLGINNISQMMELIEMSDRYGIDSISAGVGIGYEMGRQDKFGDFEFAKGLLKIIAAGEHGLSEGVMRYSNRDKNAMQVKGVEFAAYPGHTNLGYAFAIAGPHTSMDTYNRAWKFPEDNTVDGWVGNILRGIKAILPDEHGMCKFAKPTFEEIATLYDSVYGEQISVDDLNKNPVDVYLKARAIDAKLGFTNEDDTLPDRCFEPYNGSKIPHFNTREFFEEVKTGVYEKLSQNKK